MFAPLPPGTTAVHHSIWPMILGIAAFVACIGGTWTVWRRYKGKKSILDKVIKPSDTQKPKSSNEKEPMF